MFETVDDWISEFSPAVGGSTGRDPLWYTLRYMSGREKTLLLLLKYVGLPYSHLTYTQRVKRAHPITVAWFPGYMFLNFCQWSDNWAQILRMPGAIEFLGEPSPLPAGVVEDLALRLPQKLARPSKLSCFAPGVRVRVKSDHPLEGHEATVTWADRRSVKVIAMLFNRPTEVKLDASEVETV